MNAKNILPYIPIIGIFAVAYAQLNWDEPILNIRETGFIVSAVIQSVSIVALFNLFA